MLSVSIISYLMVIQLSELTQQDEISTKYVCIYSVIPAAAQRRAGIQSILGSSGCRVNPGMTIHANGLRVTIYYYDTNNNSET